MVDLMVNQKYNEGVNKMEIKQISEKLDKVFFAFKNAKENKKDNKVYKQELENIVKNLKEVEDLLIKKQKDEFFDREQKIFYDTMNNIYVDNLNTLQNCQSMENTKKLLDICVLAKEQKEKTYLMIANTYGQFHQMITNLKQQIAQELNTTNLALTKES